MPSAFAALENKLSREVDTVFGEDFVHLPMKQATPNSRRETNADLPQTVFVGVFDDRTPGSSSSFSRLGPTSGGHATSGGAPQFTGSSPMLFVDDGQFDTAPARLDRIRRVDTGAVYEITNIAKDGVGRLMINLVQVV